MKTMMKYIDHESQRFQLYPGSGKSVTLYHSRAIFEECAKPQHSYIYTISPWSPLFNRKWSTEVL